MCCASEAPALPARSARTTPSRNDAPHPTSQGARAARTEPREKSGGGRNQVAKPPGVPKSLTVELRLADCNGLLGEGLARMRRGRRSRRYRSRGASKEPHTSRRRLVPRLRPAPVGPAPAEHPYWLDASPRTLPLAHGLNGSLRIFFLHFVADHNAPLVASVAPAMGRTR